MSKLPIRSSGSHTVFLVDTSKRLTADNCSTPTLLPILWLSDGQLSTGPHGQWVDQCCRQICLRWCLVWSLCLTMGPGPAMEMISSQQLDLRLVVIAQPLRKPCQLLPSRPASFWMKRSENTFIPLLCKFKTQTPRLWLQARLSLVVAARFLLLFLFVGKRMVLRCPFFGEAIVLSVFETNTSQSVTQPSKKRLQCRHFCFWQVDADVSRLELSARALRMAWHVLAHSIPTKMLKAIQWDSVGSGKFIYMIIPMCLHLACFNPALQASLLRTGHFISSACTGVYTVECAAGLIEKTVNGSNLVDFKVYLQSQSCFETRFWRKI